ncbi:MAG: tetratricopeptide repeat protein [Spirochaetes bacterium]|nr:tetratricopeptide repeat protein [Spirochaetota bacterium]
MRKIKNVYFIVFWIFFMIHSGYSQTSPFKECMELFNKNDFKNAYNCFIKVTNSSVRQDALFFAAQSAINIKKNEDAKKILYQLIKAEYNSPQIYLLLASLYANDPQKMNAIYRDGNKRFPESMDILVGIINHSLGQGQYQDVIKYTGMALKINSTNKTMHFARAFAYEMVKEPEKALESYKKAIKIDPDYFNAYFNVSAIYFNKALEHLNKANYSMNDKIYNQERLKAKEYFKLSLPYLEKAHKLNPDDKDTIESLKGVYQKLDMTEPYNKLMEEIKKEKKK